MSNFPSVKAKNFIKVIKKLGFYLDRQKGSHAIYKDSRGNRVVIPLHSVKDIKQGTLMGMIEDIGLDKETFFDLLAKLRQLCYFTLLSYILQPKLQKWRSHSLSKGDRFNWFCVGC